MIDVAISHKMISDYPDEPLDFIKKDLVLNIRGMFIELGERFY